MKEIETSKGWFVVCDKTDDSFLNLICKYEPIKLSEITSKEAYEITDKKANPKDDLFRLLESQGIEITNNTYIFKV